MYINLGDKNLDFKEKSIEFFTFQLSHTKVCKKYDEKASINTINGKATINVVKGYFGSFLIGFLICSRKEIPLLLVGCKFS